MSRYRWRIALNRRSSAMRRWAIDALATRQKASTKKRIIVATLIFALAFAVRLLHAVDLIPLMYTDEQPFGGLTETYDLRAVSILKGEGLLGPYNIDPSDTKWLSQAPGYSIFLSGVNSVVGRDFFAVQLVQNAINSFSAVLIFLIAGALLSWRIGVASGLLAALSHHLGHISNFILPDSLHAFPVLAGLYFLTRARHSRHWMWFYSAAGLMFGLATWFRAQTMLLGLFAGALIVMLAATSARRRRVAKRVGLMAAISILAIAPITIRNYAVYGEFVPVQLGVGLNLWEGIGDASGDRFGAVRQDTEVANQEAEWYGDARYAGTWATPDGIKRDRDRTNRSLSVIVRHPIWYAGVVLARWRDMLKYSAHAPLVFTIDEAGSLQRTKPIKQAWMEFAAERAASPGQSIFWLRPVVRTLQRLAKETLLLFIIIGAVALFIVSGRRAVFLSVVPLYYFLFQAAMHTEFRYTLPMQYFIFVFAAAGWVLISASILGGFKYLIRSQQTET